MSKSKEFLLFNLNRDIKCSHYEVKRILNQIKKFIKNTIKFSNIKIKNIVFTKKIDPLRYIVVDVECNYPKIIGIAVFNRIYQFYILNENFQFEFYKTIIKLLDILKNFYIFSFSDNEKKFIFSILKNELSSDLKTEELKFIDNLKILNLQVANYESLITALYKIKEKVGPEQLLRNSKDIDFHYALGHIDLILEHNISCLLEAIKILYKRFFSMHLIDSPSLGRFCIKKKKN